MTHADSRWYKILMIASGEGGIAPRGHKVEGRQFSGEGPWLLILHAYQRPKQNMSRASDLGQSQFERATRYYNSLVYVEGGNMKK